MASGRTHEASVVALSWAQEREWWLGNRLGGWASGTISSINTSKYHSLLAVPSPSPESILLLLSKFEETVLAGAERHGLSSNCYPGVIHPDGYTRISRFSFDSAAARWTYQAAGRRIGKEVWCESGQNCTYARYTLLEGEPAGFEVRPFVLGRPAHSIGLPGGMANRSSHQPSERGIDFSFPFEWSIRCDLGQFRYAPDIYRQLQYPLEAERQEPAGEDALCPGSFEFFLKEGQHATVCAQAPAPAGGASSFAPDSEAGARRLERLADDFRAYNKFAHNPSLESLVRASDIFIMRDGRRYNIVAGYPYFGRWARDAMIALPGLCIYTGRHALARDILQFWLEHMRNGLLPNRFDEQGRPLFESSDGALWMFWAISHLDAEGALLDSTLRSWWPALRSSLRAWIAGNGRAILDGDGLISLDFSRDSWMDAQADGKAFTPRAGKRVEINALWIHALSNASQWASRMNDAASASLFDETAIGARHSFSKFFNPYSRYLDDGIEPTDGSLRPNAIWALALPNLGLGPVQQIEALRAIKEKLLLPGAGLRTLSPDDKNYHSRYFGNQRSRDEAYHQGAAWPWLLGAYAEASLRLHPHRPMEAYSCIEPFFSKERSGALFSIPEVFDPSTLTAGGAPLQAWSVGEVLRAAVLLERAISVPSIGTGARSIKDTAALSPPQNPRPPHFSSSSHSGHFGGKKHA